MPIKQQVIAKLFARQSLSADEAEAMMNEIMDGAATPAQVGAYLAALRVKGETVEEIAGSARAMRKHAVPVATSRTNLVDVVGTGGDKSGTFNISTTSMFVVAGAGAPVAKHGNRAASSKAGSADVLAALGVNIALTAAQTARCIDTVGLGFMFAQTHHPAMKHAAGARRELGARTIFNILGPLTNPAGAKRQLLGVFDPALTEVMAGVLRDLGSEHVLVVHSGGVDELTPCAPCKITELGNGTIRTYTLGAADAGLEPCALEALLGGTADENAAITRAVLEGAGTTAQRDAVLFNSGAALYAADVAPTVAAGVALARESIASGAAHRKLDQLVQISNSFGSP